MAAPDHQRQSPLPRMDKLSPCVFLYKPPSGSRTSQTGNAGPTPPKLILLITWMSARDAHIAKYFSKYQEMYPSAQIMLIRTGPGLFATPARKYREIQPAVSAIRAALDTGASADDSETGPKQPQLLVHLLSNGGSIVLENIYRAYRAQATANESPFLPPSVKIFDSAPGEFGFKIGMTAMTAWAISPWLRLIVVPIMYVLVVYYWMFHEDILAKTFVAHNDRQEDCKLEVRRAYIYSDKDQLIQYKSVEKHENQAARAGFDTRIELFKGAAHVAHMQADPERYWKIVRETWEGRAEK